MSSWGERGDDKEVGEDGSENDGDRNEEDGDDDDDDGDVDLQMVVRTWTEVTGVRLRGLQSDTEPDVQTTNNNNSMSRISGRGPGGQGSSLIYPIILRGANVTFERGWFL